MERLGVPTIFFHAIISYDTSSILANIKSMMHDKSLLFITVPNSLALSRRLALEMGLVSSLSALTENDHKHGHRRTYTADSLRSEVKEAGFKVVKEQGIVMKILADFRAIEVQCA